MPHRILAWLVVFLHFSFVIFALFGGLLVLHWRWLYWIQIPAAIWGTAVAVCDWNCPLTRMENALRRTAGADEYTGGFVERYLLPASSGAELRKGGKFLLGASVAVVNLAVYAFVWQAS
jgi:hypothetical protein